MATPALLPSVGRAGWDNVGSKTYVENAKDVGKSVGISMLIKEGAKFDALLAKEGIEAVASSTDNEWDSLIKKSLEWQLIRREVLAIESLLDVLYAAYNHDLNQIIIEMQRAAPYQRNFRVIVSKPIVDVEDVSVRATLNEPGWLARPLFTDHPDGAPYLGQVPYESKAQQHELTWNASDADKSDSHLVFPISDGSQTWNWTFDVTPGSPAYRLNRETFQWSDTTNSLQADTSYSVLFGSDIKLELREETHDVTVVH